MENQNNAAFVERDDGGSAAVTTDWDGLKDAEHPQFNQKEFNQESIDSSEREESPEEIESIMRQTADASALLSFCDLKRAEKILHSDDYKVLLDHRIGIEDLINADALFGERYYSDGYTADFDWRYRHGNRSKTEALRRVNGSGIGQYYDDGRVEEAERAIAILASSFDEKDGDTGSKGDHYASIIARKKTFGNLLTDVQKEFLENEEPNELRDRLLYGPKNTSEERLEDISNSIDNIENHYKEESEQHGEEWATREMWNRIVFAEESFHDYEMAGKDDMVWRKKLDLTDIVDRNFDKLVESEPSNDDFYFGAESRVILNYSNPYDLVERCKKHNLTDEDNAFRIDADQIVDAIRRNRYGRYEDILAEGAGDLLEMGASEDNILESFDQFRAIDFTRSRFGRGEMLLKAGVNREKVLSQIFCADNAYWPQNNEPFRKETVAPEFEGKSYADVLEDAGFTMTEIAQTFSPDIIARNLSEFVERGADAKELAKYMVSYKEYYKDNFDGGTYYYIAHDGENPMIIYDKNHPEGRTINKGAMPGTDGIDYVAVNLDFFAEHGVTETDIIESMSGSEATPWFTMIPKLMECKKFDAGKVLTEGHKKYSEYLDWAVENGFDKDYVKQEKEFTRYISKVFEQLSDSNKKNRDDNLRYAVKEQEKKFN